MLLVANATATVVCDSRLNSLCVKRNRRLDLPTPESPISTTRGGGGGEGGERMGEEEREGRGREGRGRKGRGSKEWEREGEEPNEQQYQPSYHTTVMTATFHYVSYCNTCQCHALFQSTADRHCYVLR